MKDVKTLRRLLALLILSAIFVFPSVATRADDEKALRITPKAFLDHIKILSSDKYEGRDTGSKGQKLAAKYIAGKLKDWGVPPAGDNGSYFQKFPYSGNRDIVGKPVLKARNGRSTFRMKYARNFTPMTCSADADIKKVPVVFAGYGVDAPDKNYNDYTGIDVKDKFVIIMRKTPWPRDRRSRHAYFRTKLEVAKKHGVGGVIFVSNPKSGAAELNTLRKNADRKRMPFPVFYITGKAANRLLSRDKQTLEKLESKIIDSGKPASFPLKRTTIDAKVKLKEKGVGTENVVAIIKGSDKSSGNEHIIMGAHYDHIGVGSSKGKAKIVYHGADDNASGSSGLLVIARAISDMNKKPKRTIVFVWFTGEEKGFLGSIHYTENPALPLKDAVLMINMDMLGRSKDGYLWIGGADTGKDLRPVLEELADASGLDVRLTGSAGGSSDQVPFNRKNVPNLFFNSGMHKDLHRTTDTVDKINAEDGARIVNLALDVAIAVADGGKKHEFNKTESGRGSRVFMGLAGMEQVEKGLQITGVVPHSPAEKAGLEKDDIIISINDKEIKTNRDLYGCLRGKKPGDVLKMVVIRDGKEEKISLKLDKR